ncbi:hypothetical protein [Catalinimonas alkaloidigena]|uniref:hypothetical protein n=1 Tax=Catalinimonas alkaloidigena TaxID=1075417 RepID=UPI00240572AF|nr:hypothetical protein [Catalinimonas alkaloidigena]
MNSPLGIVALLLWGILLVLAIRQYRKWTKASRKEKIIYQNHPAIPVKEYKLSEFEVSDEQVGKNKPKPASQLKHSQLNLEKQRERLASLRNAWDV